MNRTFVPRKIICIIFIITLNFSCNNAGISSKTHSGEKEKLITVVINADYNKLKYTSGIRGILHDSKGNYWFGSHQEGVCKYDGKTFTYFTIEDGLSDNQVKTIQEDRAGIIWFGTTKGVSSYNGKIITDHNKNTSTFKSITAPKVQWELVSDDLWFNAGRRTGVYRFNGIEVNYLALPLPENSISQNQFTYEVTDFTKDKNDTLWIATYSTLFGFDGSSFKIINDSSLGYNERIDNLHIRSIFYDSKGNLWIGNNGIGVLLRNNGKTVNFSENQGLLQVISPRNGSPSPFGTLEHVFAIEEDNQGNIWFGDRDTGAWSFDGQSMQNYSVDNTLETQHIWDIYQDWNGDLLFAMSTGGVYVFNGNTFDRKF